VSTSNSSAARRNSAEDNFIPAAENLNLINIKAKFFWEPYGLAVPRLENTGKCHKYSSIA
jgi:hypothetical protein